MNRTLWWAPTTESTKHPESAQPLAPVTSPLMGWSAPFTLRVATARLRVGSLDLSYS